MSDFKPMLAKAPKMKDGEPVVAYPLVAQEKLDGIRASVVNGKLVTRTLKPVPNAEIRAYMERPEFEGFDGELLVGDPTAEDAYRTTTSFVMSSSKTGAPWAFYAFDLWNTDMGFHEREAFMAQRMMLSRMDPVRIKQVRCQTVTSATELAAFEERVIADGHEGVILRDPAALYKFGRSGSKGPLLKLKRFVDFEAEVIGVYEEMHNANEAKTNELGRTERSSHAAGKIGKGTLGGLVLRGINEPAKGIEFRCGTGFDAAERQHLWEDYDDGNGLNGMIAKVKSFPIGVKDKPRHPVFLGWRAAEDMPDA